MAGLSHAWRLILSQCKSERLVNPFELSALLQSLAVIISFIYSRKKYSNETYTIFLSYCGCNHADGMQYGTIK